MGIAWTGWAGQLGILDMSMQPETALGIGMLGAIAGVRWAIGRFEGAKRKWWKDYNRVGEGLERDLKVSKKPDCVTDSLKSTLVFVFTGYP